MTAAPTVERPPALEPSAEVLTLAGDMYTASDLRLRRNITPDRARTALARGLMLGDPAHRELLARALRRRTASERKRGPRPDDQRAARRLIESGMAPTPRAVAALLESQATKRAADQARAGRVRPLVDRDGGAAASYVRDFRRRHGRGPRFGMLTRHFRGSWRASDGPAIIRGLLAEGWLTATHGRPASLDVGPRAKGLT
jgi:hypothetical protein